MASGSILLTGCLPVPIFEHPPFEEKALLIKEGETTRLEALTTLGEPVLSRGEDEVFVYTGSQLQMAFVGVVSPAGGIVALTTGNYHLLVIEFDPQGVVQHAEVVTTRFLGLGFDLEYYAERPTVSKVCTSTRVCFHKTEFTHY